MPFKSIPQIEAVRYSIYYLLTNFLIDAEKHCPKIVRLLEPSEHQIKQTAVSISQNLTKKTFRCISAFSVSISVK